MPVNIKGKDYVTVAERMEGMRQAGKPFEIVESMPIQIGDRCVWRVAILLDGCKFYGSAEAHFNAKVGSADATDPFACAETSAIGRALGFAGYGSVDSIASADELVRTQEPRRIAPAQQDADTTKRLSQVKQLFQTLYKPEKWDAFKVHHLGMPVSDDGLDMQELDKLYVALVEAKDAAKQKKAS